jgi:hypothetical protein
MPKENNKEENSNLFSTQEDLNFFLSHVYYLWLHSDLLMLFNIFNGFKGLHKTFLWG